LGGVRGRVIEPEGDVKAQLYCELGRAVKELIDEAMEKGPVAEGERMRLSLMLINFEVGTFNEGV
jgi:hypothetical protein